MLTTGVLLYLVLYIGKCFVRFLTIDWCNDKEKGSHEEQVGFI